MESQSLSLWAQDVKCPTFGRLSADRDTDVCIIGGGIAGLTTAYLLASEGLRVIVLENGGLGLGQTARTTAQFATALDRRYFEIVKGHGRVGARLAALSHRYAIELVASICKNERIECDLNYVDGYLFLGPEHTRQLLDKEFAAITSAGINDVVLLENFSAIEGIRGPALKFVKQLQLHPIKYLSGLINSITKYGGSIFTDTMVCKVNGGDNPSLITQDNKVVKAKAIVVATNSPINDSYVLHTKQAPYRSYVIAFKIAKNSVPRALFWDTADPYHYVRIDSSRPDYDLLLIGGEDHKTGQNLKPQKCYERLEAWSRQHFSMAKEILYKWSGQVMEPVDGLAYLGRNPLDKNVYVITGHSGNGTTYCTIGAKIIHDQILNQPNEWQKLYDPSRINVHSGKEFIKENANVAAQYGEWLNLSSVDEVKNLPIGEGTVYHRGVDQVAVYRKNKSEIEVLSAICPHLGCIVTWNSAEKSWDCPCHGSRFNCKGQVIEGPAARDLQELHPPAAEKIAAKLRKISSHY